MRGHGLSETGQVATGRSLQGWLPAFVDAWHASCRTAGMSVVRIKDEPTPRPLTGGMDRTFEKRRLPWWAKYAIGGAVALTAALIWWLSPGGSSQTVTTDRLVISEVRKGVFDDFLPLRGRVTPLVTVYLD